MVALTLAPTVLFAGPRISFSFNMIAPPVCRPIVPVVPVYPIPAYSPYLAPYYYYPYYPRPIMPHPPLPPPPCPWIGGVGAHFSTR